MTRIGVQVLGNPGEAGVEGWRELLIREGLPHSVSPAVTGEYPVTVAVGGPPESPPGPGEFQIIDGQGAGEGTGPVMAVQRMLPSGAPVRVQGTARTPAPPWTSDPDAPVLVPFAEEGPLASGHQLASRYLCGRRALLPMPLGAQLSWTGSAFCAYEHASLLPDAAPAGEYEEERIELPLPVIDRNGVCRLMAGTLRLAFARCGLPYVRVWYYPSPHRGVLLARFDVDVLDEPRLAEIGRRTLAQGRRAAFFINLSGEEEYEDATAAAPGANSQYARGTVPVTERPVKQPNVLRGLSAAGHELASHGYRHTVFPTAARCREDIGHSLVLLRELGADVYGYGAPGGIWLPSLQDALESLGLGYSSELSCGFDGFPFWPSANAPDGPLQIPVSPFLQCGLARREPARELVRAWGAYCDECCRRAEPASFILHTQDFAQLPLEVYDALLEHASRCQLLDLTFTEFARWWRHRTSLQMTAVWDGKEVEVKLSEPAPIDINGRIQILDSQEMRHPVPV